MKYETLVLDIDGTLINDKLEISKNTVETVEKLNSLGVRIIFCSGRMFKSAKNFIRKNFGFSAPVISYNGGMVHLDLDSAPVAKHSIDLETSLKLVDFLRIQNCHYQMYLKDELIAEKNTSELIGYSKHAGVEYKVVEDMKTELLKNGEGAAKMLVIADETLLDSISEGASDLFSEELNIFKSYSNYLDFIPRITNKGIALKELSLLMGFELSNSVMIGDGENDSFAFDYVGTAIAMGNAPQALKSRADYITEDNNHEGAFIAMRSHFIDILGK